MHLATSSAGALIRNVDATNSQVSQFVSTANISSIPTEIATAIFSKLWDINDMVSSLCLGLTCKSLSAIHKMRPNKRAIDPDERSVCALTAEEQRAEPRGVMMVFATLNALLGDTQGRQPIGADELFLWGPEIILQRKGRTDIFCLYRDINSTFKPKATVLPNSDDSNFILGTTRTSSFKRTIAWNYFQTSNQLALKVQLRGTLESGGEWNLKRVLTTWYEYADGKGGLVTEATGEFCLRSKEVVKKWLIRSRSPGWTNVAISLQD